MCDTETLKPVFLLRGDEAFQRMVAEGHFLWMSTSIYTLLSHKMDRLRSSLSQGLPFCQPPTHRGQLFIHLPVLLCCLWDDTK